MASVTSLVEEIEATGGEDVGAPGAEVWTRQILLSTKLRTFEDMDE